MVTVEAVRAQFCEAMRTAGPLGPLEQLSEGHVLHRPRRPVPDKAGVAAEAHEGVHVRARDAELPPVGPGDAGGSEGSRPDVAARGGLGQAEGLRGLAKGGSSVGR